MMIRLLLFALPFIIFGCADDACVKGQQVSCACPSGINGSQTCVDGSSFSACTCEDPDAGMSNNDMGVSDVTLDVTNDRDTGSQTALFMERLPGLWIGGASQTPLGTFPLMNMDVRVIGDRFLFSRVDLDVDNAVRFAFYREEIGGENQLVYRNGGLFVGLERDTRTVLVDETENTYRFCEPERGCDYLEATWTFESETELVLDVRVGQMPHLLWDATRVETREVTTPFPTDNPYPENSPFPEMSTLAVTANVSTPSIGDSFVWVVLSDTACGFTGRDCNPSRSIRISLFDGATSGTATISQIHDGQYFTNAIWDRNSNFATAPFPDSGDEVAIPDGQVTVTTGATLNITTSFTVP